MDYEDDPQPHPCPFCERPRRFCHCTDESRTADLLGFIGRNFDAHGAVRHVRGVARRPSPRKRMAGNERDGHEAQ